MTTTHATRAKMLLALLALFLVIGLAACGGGKPAATTAVTVAPVTAPPTTHTANPWIASASPVINAFQNDLPRFQTAAKAVDWTGMSTAATALIDDAQAGLNLPASPNAVLQLHWTAAMTYFMEAAKDIQKGSDTFDASTVNTAQAQINHATDELGQVVAQG